MDKKKERYEDYKENDDQNQNKVSFLNNIPSKKNRFCH